MKILIVGGGVGGLALAGFLKKYGFAGRGITLVEQAPEFHNIGFVIGLWGNGRRILKELGIEHQVVDKDGYEIVWNGFEDAHGKLLAAIPIYAVRESNSAVIITRSALQKGLVEAAKDVDIRLGTSVIRVEQGATGVSVEFSGGNKDFFDIVVGADGIRSSIREMVFGPGFFHYYDWGGWVYWLPDFFKNQPQPMSALGNSRVCALFPAYNRATAMFVAKVPHGTERTAEDRASILRELFKDFRGPVPEILRVMPDAKEIFYSDLGYVEMPQWYKGRVVLLGDAQHATSPLSGMGASMALEDAFVLADELRKSWGKDIDAAIKGYAQRRTKRIKQFHKITGRVDGWTMAGVLRENCGIFSCRLRRRHFSCVPYANFCSRRFDLCGF